jgi:hypothetical protein
MLEELRRQMAQLERERALSMLAHVEELLRALADMEDLFGVLTLACEDPSLRQIVAGRFKFLEACMAALAAAAGCVPPEPAEVGK